MTPPVLTRSRTMPAMRRRRPRRLVALVLACLLAVVAGGCSIGGSGTTTVQAEFVDSAGLFVGNDVGVLGVVVGSITAIEPVGDRVVVTMEIDADQDVPADAGAVVVARSVATDRYVELTPVYSGGPKLAAGDVIPMKRTRTPVDFDQVLASLNDFATGIGGSKATTRAVQRFIDAGTRALDGRGPLLNQTIHSLSDGVDGIASQKDDIVATVRSLDTLVSTITANQGTARTFIQQVSRATAILARERVNFRRALRALDTAVTAVADFAVRNRKKIVRTLNGTTDLMDTVLTKQNDLAEILRVMPLGLQNIRLATANPDGRLPVRVDPLVLDPLGGLLQQICGSLPGNLCDILDGSTPGDDR